MFGKRLDLINHQTDSDSRKPLTLQGGTFQATVLHSLHADERKHVVCKGHVQTLPGSSLADFYLSSERQ